MKIVKVKCGDRSIPGWVVKTLKGTKKTAPYMFKAVTPEALDNLGDLAAWCQNNGSPASKVINTGSGRFIKIADPLCRELELANLVKDEEDGEVLDTLDNLSRIFKITAIRIDKDFNVNYSGRTVEAIEAELNKLQGAAKRLLSETQAAVDYVKKTRNEAAQLQKQINNPKVLVK